MQTALVLFGSSRRHGNTGQLVDLIATALAIEVVDLSPLKISPYDYEHRNRDDDFEPLMARVLGVDHLIIASPVYWYAVSPPVKVFLDRISDYLDIPALREDGRRLRGKTGHIVCTSIYDEPPHAFVDALTATFDYLGIQRGLTLHVNCANGFARSACESQVAAFVDRFRGTGA